MDAFILVFIDLRRITLEALMKSQKVIQRIDIFKLFLEFHFIYLRYVLLLIDRVTALLYISVQSSYLVAVLIIEEAVY